MYAEHEVSSKPNSKELTNFANEFSVNHKSDHSRILPDGSVWLGDSTMDSVPCDRISARLS